jgi:AcrR family transcriptional regulator
MTPSTRSKAKPDVSRPSADPFLDDRRARRREVRREQSQADILDAAEMVFGEDGIRDGSLRRIASMSGFSVGAMYLFFENKADLLAKTLARRGGEWNKAIMAIIANDSPPLEQLHQVIDFASSFCAEHPHFRQLLSQVSHGTVIAGHSLAAPSDGEENGFFEIMAALTSAIERGQAQRVIRSGDARSLAHLYSLLVNEYVLLEATPSNSRLTPSEFHAFIGGALRNGQPM